MFRPITIARIFFVALATACGYWISHDQDPTQTNASAIVAFILALIIVTFEYSLRAVSTKRVFVSALGLLFGLIVATLLYETIPASIMPRSTARIVCNFLFGYLGITLALKHADQINFGSFRFLFSNPEYSQTRLLDTSVIIDGRVEEMIRGGFLPGSVIVPSFVIDELQRLADSADAIKRGKGRRGLDILESIQNEFPSLEIVEKDYPEVRDVDRKLLEMSKDIGAQVVTNDHNLQKVAALHKVPVMNINELADLLRPPVYVGETFPLAIIREGKEPGQGVGYLKDGTMVVVDDGRSRINQEIDVLVTSILQTNTGRMVFARPLNNDESNNHGGASASKS